MASQRLLPDVSRLLGARLLLPLVVAASLLALAAGTAAGSGQAFAVAPGVLLPLCSALLLAFISPLPPQVRCPLSLWSAVHMPSVATRSSGRARSAHDSH